MSDDQTQEHDDSQEPDHIRSLREKAKQADQLQSQQSALERKVAILEAGINTSTPLGAMFLKSYEGELDAEAIRAEAAKVGLVAGQPDPDPQPGEPGTAEAEYADARRRLTQGETAPHETPQKSATDLAYKAFEDARKQGKRSEDAQVDGFRTMIEQAAQGNPTALFNERQWNERLAREGSANP